MNSFRSVCLISRRKRISFFFFAAAFFFLWQAGFGKCFGADFFSGIGLPETILVASARPTGDSLISLPDKKENSDSTGKTAPATAPKTKYPRPNEMLQGVVYDLKRTKDLKPSGIQSASDNLSRANSFLQVTKGFVLGQWTTKIGGDGLTRYSDLDNYFCLPTHLANSFFYLADSHPEDAPRLLHSESDMNAGAWVGIWSGYIVAPFTGKFRFVGFGDDQLLVRFNKKIVLDYGWAITTMGIRTAAYSNIISNLSGSPADASQAQLIQNSPLYSSYRLETFPASYSNNWAYGLQRGAIQTVQKGQIIPIEILIGEIGDGSFSTALFVEQLDSKGRPLNNNPQKLPLFRTTTHLPPHSSVDLIPDFEDDGPIWKVVDQFGKTIPAKTFAGQKVRIGLQLDDGIDTNQQTVASTTTTKPKTAASSVNYEDELPGVLYDLKQTSDGESTGLMEMQSGKQFNRIRTMLSVWNLPDTAGKESVMVPYLKRFVVSNWPHKSDSTGQLSFNEFRQFSRSPVNSFKSYFYQPIISSANAPKSYSGDGRVSDGGWVAINSGYVVAPFTGKFRFVGFGDDALVVRFNNQIVLDYGWYALSLGKMLDDTWEWKAILGGTAAKTDPQNRMVLNNPVYSQCKLETYFSSMFDGHGLAKGVPISVTKGKHYPIQILVTDIISGSFGTALLIERLDSTGVPLKKDPAKLPLFRTSSTLPGHSSGSSFPDFDDDSPIWKVVDAKGKPIPSHKPPVVEETQVADEKTPDAALKNESVVQEKQPAESTSLPQRDPNLRKVVSKTTRGNITTETVTEYGDTTIETVTTTEVNGDTTIQTTVMTETKKGIVVKKSSSTTTTTKQPDTSSDSSAQSSAEPQTEQAKEKSKPAYNPFGYTQPLPEDD